MNKRLLFLILVAFVRIDSVYGQMDDSTQMNRVILATQFLQRAQTESGSIQDSTNNLFSIWETIIAVDALLDVLPASDTTINKAVTWLSSNTNPQGLVCHNLQCASDYCIETSALYLRLRKRLNPSLDLSEQLKSIEQLQEKNGSWKVGNPDVTDKTEFPSVTGFVLNLLEECHFHSSRKMDAFLFLISSQLENGSWGQTWEYYNCPGYALWQCLPAMKKCPSGAITFEKGKAFILDSQLADGSWYFVENQSSNHVSAALQTAFMLTCLQTEKDERSKNAWTRGMAYLLDQQLSNGSWDGGFFPIPNQRYKKREYIVATALILKLLLATDN